MVVINEFARRQRQLEFNVETSAVSVKGVHVHVSYKADTMGNKRLANSHTALWPDINIA